MSGEASKWIPESIKDGRGDSFENRSNERRGAKENFSAPLVVFTKICLDAPSSRRLSGKSSFRPNHAKRDASRDPGELSGMTGLCRCDTASRAGMFGHRQKASVRRHGTVP